MPGLPLRQFSRVRIPQLAPGVCYMCRYKARLHALRSVRLRGSRNHLQPFPLPARRNASSIISATAVNAPLDVQPAFRELYAALKRLESDAANYASLSRVRLATRSLEGDDAVVRVAVLGIGLEGFGAAKKLARLLLLDPLGRREEWESELVKDDGDGRGLLLRYAADQNPAPNSAIRVVPTPSRVLRKHNLELLVVPVSLDARLGLKEFQAIRPQDALLVPAVDTPASSTGRFTQITYPVHKTIVVGSGLRSAVQYGRFTTFGEIANSLVTSAVDIPGVETQDVQSQAQGAVAVNLNLADNSVEVFRKSTSNATAYEQGWFKSGVPALYEWLQEGTLQSHGTPKAAVTALISSLLADTEQRITEEAEEARKTTEAASVSESARQSLLQSISAWAEYAHTELRDSLDFAFEGTHWRKLSWWKLAWRVDDVGMIASEILERRWLNEAEKGLIFVAGRAAEAGVTAAPKTPAAQETNAEEQQEDVEFGSWRPPAPAMRDLVRSDAKHRVYDDGSPLPPASLPLQPWSSLSSAIPLARHHLLASSIPPLQALAQKLVLQALTAVSLTSAVSALAYVGVSTTSLYEAGAVAAFGVVWAARGVQKDWEKARKRWEEEVREEGRRALKEAEEAVRTVVVQGGRASVDEVAERDRELAREAVERVRTALEKLV